MVFEPVGQKLKATDATAVQQLWLTYGALTDELQIAERINHVALLVRHQEAGIIGLSTVKPAKIKSYNDNLFYEFRCFISPDYRAPALDTKLLVETKSYFEQHNTDNAVGMIMVIENEMIKKNWTKAVWPGPDMVFAGYTSKGDHIRISYFKKARI